jgi:hypothetical protein
MSLKLSAQKNAKTILVNSERFRVLWSSNYELELSAGSFYASMYELLSFFEQLQLMYSWKM